MTALLIESSGQAWPPSALTAVCLIVAAGLIDSSPICILSGHHRLGRVASFNDYSEHRHRHRHLQGLSLRLDVLQMLFCLR